MLDALVIGAGPSGARAAWNLSKAGYDVSLVEEDDIVGEPCQCAGLITPRTFEYLGYLPTCADMFSMHWARPCPRHPLSRQCHLR